MHQTKLLQWKKWLVLVIIEMQIFKSELASLGSSEDRKGRFYKPSFWGNAMKKW